MNEPIATIQDDRSFGEKQAWRILGAPLYYCEACLRRVHVRGDPAQVIRDCEHHDSRVIAPRRAVVHGEGGLSMQNKLVMGYSRIMAAITSRTV